MRRLFTCLAVVVLVGAASALAQAPKKTFMWIVSAPGAPPTYLVGSLHILTPDYYPLSARIEQAFAQSKVLIEEVDIDEMTAPGTVMAVMGKALFTDGRTLDQVITPALYKEVITRGEKAGLPAAALQRMKPWLAAVSLTVPALSAAGFNTELGVDKYFFDKAKKAGLERRALETVPYQIDRLDQMAPAVQEAMLKSAIADIDNQVSNVKTIADAWARGDATTIERQLLAAFLESPVIYERMLVERNRNWIEPVETCLKQKTACFVVVGAAHLVGPHSVIALLQKKGYKVEQQ
ncbi:MAG TPA: TraB/GumN family protein [Vicinamibacterales bacterium]|nr:TraB/GumN family protein [Vicinamibacterales bacterium]